MKIVQESLKDKLKGPNKEELYKKFNYYEMKKKIDPYINKIDNPKYIFIINIIVKKFFIIYHGLSNPFAEYNQRNLIEDFLLEKYQISNEIVQEFLKTSRRIKTKSDIYLDCTFGYSFFMENGEHVEINGLITIKNGNEIHEINIYDYNKLIKFIENEYENLKNSRTLSEIFSLFIKYNFM